MEVIKPTSSDTTLLDVYEKLVTDKYDRYLSGIKEDSQPPEKYLVELQSTFSKNFNNYIMTNEDKLKLSQEFNFRYICTRDDFIEARELFLAGVL